MILDAILGSMIALVGALVALLPADTGIGPPVPLDTSGMAQVLGLAMLFDVGAPVHEGIAAIAGFFAVTLSVDVFVAFRAAARWLPSWLTGGG